MMSSQFDGIKETILMFHTVLYIFIPFSMGCQLLDNTVNGGYGTAPESSPLTEIRLNLKDCSTAPLEKLPYSCRLAPETITLQTTENTSNYKLISGLDISYDLINNTCTGLSISSDGLIEGQLEKIVTQSCSLTVRASLGKTITAESLSLTVAPSLSFTFDRENIFLQEGQPMTSVNLVLSDPAPYDTYVEFDIYGDTEPVVSGIPENIKRIEILKGQSVIALELSVTSGSSIGNIIHQQLKLVTGSSQALPALSITSFESLVVPHSFEEISTGYYHTCGIDDGKLFCWGSDSHGQIGNGSLSMSPQSPEQIGTSVLWESVSAGHFHTCGINSGELFCWGWDWYGTLGNGGGSNANVDVPEKIGSSTTWENISPGSSHTCGIDAGKLYCWGRDSDFGQVGNGGGTSSNVTAPQRIGSSVLWESVSAGSDHNCGIDDSKLYCWGWGSYGQVANGTVTKNEAPLRVGSSQTWSAISSGGYHSCGIDNDKLFCWGKDDYGQVGNGSASSTVVVLPEEVGGLKAWETVTTGISHTCAITSGELYCWGRDDKGQIGNGSDNLDYIVSPEQIGQSNLWQRVGAGWDHTCGINGSEAYCWGLDSSGQIGDRLSSNNELPSQVGSALGWQDIGIGVHHTCAIKSGQLHCFGRNTKGQIGNNSQIDTNVLMPTKIANLQLWQSVGAGASHSCGIHDSNLFCWGRNAFGEVGTGDFNQRIIPVKVGTGNTWENLAVGEWHNCGVSAGELFCWGRGSNGQLGNGSDGVINVLVPEKIGSIQEWQGLAAGSYHSCGLNAGKLYCWGADSFGQIGNGAGNTNILEPVQIEMSNTWQHLTAGSNHNCGINSGKLYCWGRDNAGQIGNGSGTTLDVQSPTQIESSSSWQSVAAGTSHTCGIDNGRLFCWGSDSSGQIGNGTGSTINIEAPQQIGSSQNWARIAAGGDTTCATNSGLLFCWGSDSYGQAAQSTKFSGSPILVIE